MIPAMKKLQRVTARSLASGNVIDVTKMSSLSGAEGRMFVATDFGADEPGEWVITWLFEDGMTITSPVQVRD